jgi:hypothetical protein
MEGVLVSTAIVLALVSLPIFLPGGRNTEAIAQRHTL